MSERIYIGNACYFIHLCDVLHNKISFKLDCAEKYFINASPASCFIMNDASSFEGHQDPL